MNENGMMRDFIIERFQELYRKYWKSTGKTQLQFAMAIQKEMPDAKVTNQYVHRWYKGTLRPGNKYLPAICKVLGVDISEFTPSTHRDLYRYSSAFSDMMELMLDKMAMENFEINVDFIHGLRCLIPFSHFFPVYHPLYYYGPNALNHQPYERGVSAPKANVETVEGLFEIRTEEKTISMTKYDLKFLREVQIEVANLVLKLFEERKKQLDQAEKDANYMFWMRNFAINPNYGKDHTLWETYVLSEEELQRIDKAGIYTEKEEKRFNLPRRGTPLVNNPEAKKETED